MGCKGVTLGFPSASFLRGSGRYHVQMFLQVRVDTTSPLFAHTALLLSVQHRITILNNGLILHFHKIYSLKLL